MRHTITMGHWDWTAFFSSRDRRNFPGVVMPLADAPAAQQPIPNAEKEKEPDNEANSNKLTTMSSEEKGASPVPQSGSLTLEALRAEVESDIAASGLDTAYDRTFACLVLCSDAEQHCLR